MEAMQRLEQLVEETRHVRAEAGAETVMVMFRSRSRKVADLICTIAENRWSRDEAELALQASEQVQGVLMIGDWGYDALMHPSAGGLGTLHAGLGLANGDPEAVFVGRANLFLAESITVADPDRAAEVRQALQGLSGHPLLPAHPIIGASIRKALARLDQIVVEPETETRSLDDVLDDLIRGDVSRAPFPQVTEWLQQGRTSFTEEEMEHIAEALTEHEFAVEHLENIQLLFTEVRAAMESDRAFGTRLMRERDQINYVQLHRLYYWLTQDHQPVRARASLAEMVEKLNFLDDSEFYVNLPGPLWATLCHAVAFVPYETDDDFKLERLQEAAGHYEDNGDEDDHLEVIILQAEIIAARGDLDEAFDLLEEARTVPRDTDLTPQLADLAILQSRIFVAAEQYEDAAEVLHDFLDTEPELFHIDRPNINAHARVTTEFARVALAAGEPDVCHDRLTEAVELYLKAGNPGAAAEIMAERIEASS